MCYAYVSTFKTSSGHNSVHRRVDVVHGPLCTPLHTDCLSESNRYALHNMGTFFGFFKWDKTYVFMCMMNLMTIISTSILRQGWWCRRRRGSGRRRNGYFCIQELCANECIFPFSCKKSHVVRSNLWCIKCKKKNICIICTRPTFFGFVLSFLLRHLPTCIALNFVFFTFQLK